MNAGPRYMHNLAGIYLEVAGIYAGLSEVFMTGGIPPGIDQPCSAHETYTCLFKRVPPDPNVSKAPTKHFVQLESVISLPDRLHSPTFSLAVTAKLTEP